MQAPHAPLEVDATYKRKYRLDSLTGKGNRKTILGMIHCMDEAIGNITEALIDTGLYNDSVIIFSSGKGL